MWNFRRAPRPGVAATNTSLIGILEHTFPTSIIDSMAKGEVLQIVVFAFIFGTACATIGIKARPVVEFCESLSEVMFRYTSYVMLFAPFGVFGAMAATIGEKGLGVMVNLGKLVLTLYCTQVFFVIVVFGGVITLLRIPLGRFIRYAREPFLLAFSTASSESALPLALKNMEAFGVPKHIVCFRAPDRIQLQSRRIDSLSFDGGHVHRAGSRNPSRIQHSTDYDVDVDADQ